MSSIEQILRIASQRARVSELKVWPLMNAIAPVAQIAQMAQRQLCRRQMVELDGHNMMLAAVAGNGHHRHGQVLVDRRIHGDDAFDRTRQQQPRVALQQIGAVAMAHHKVKEFVLQQSVFNAAQHLR